ncbi:extracellular solute-binding protein [Priestia flexa]|uniref:extracellular solute-binding protein n=1 Tax=Priestia flexa TaxID=86664 RepID=UPI002E1C3B15|nr:extracellular solute-binding protein [Priestia flexa]
MYRLQIAVVLAGMVFLLIGCNNHSIIDGTPSIVAPSKEDREVVVWHTYSEEESKVFENEIIPLFEKQHPHIDVKPVRQSYNEQLKWTLIARASAKKTPDVVRMDIAWLPFFASMGQVYPVSDFADFKNIKEKLLEAPLQSNFYKGKYYGLPLNTNTKTAIYNKKLLREAGYSKPPSKIEDLLKLIQHHGYRIGLTGYSTWETLPYFYGFGGTLLSPDHTKAEGYLNSEASINAIEKIRLLFNSSSLTATRLTGYTDTWEGIVNGDYFMMDEGPWFYSVQSPKKLNEITDNTISAPFPVTEGKGSLLGGENLVIMKGARNPEESWTFVKWMASREPQRLMFKTGLMPTIKEFTIQESTNRSNYIGSYIDGLETAFLRPPVAEWDEIDKIYSKYLRMIVLERVSIKKGLTMAAEEIDSILIDKKGR